MDTSRNEMIAYNRRLDEERREEGRKAKPGRPLARTLDRFATDCSRAYTLSLDPHGPVEVVRVRDVGSNRRVVERETVNVPLCEGDIVWMGELAEDKPVIQPTTGPVRARVWKVMGRRLELRGLPVH